VGRQPSYVQTDPTNRFLYVANAQSNNISIFTINATAGTLNAVMGSPVALPPGATSPYCIHIEKTGNFAITANNGSDNITVFNITPAIGLLTGGTNTALAAGAKPTFVTTDPSGGFLVVTDFGTNNVTVFTFAGGAPTAPTNVGSGGTGPTSIAFNPAGTFAFSANQGSNDVTPYSFAAGTLTAGTPQSMGAGSTPSGVIVDPSGNTLYVACGGVGKVIPCTIAPGTGAIAPGTGVAAGTGTFECTIDAVSTGGPYLYAVNSGSSNVQAFTIPGGVPAPDGAAVMVGTGPFSVTAFR